MNLTKKRKVNLPKNWIVVNSTSFPNRVYYFNVRTGKSSWNEPLEEADQPKAGGSGQKRKLSSDDDDNESSTFVVSSPNEPEPPKLSKRPISRPKKNLEPAKSSDTPQMIALRKKISEKKSKPKSTTKARSSESVSGNKSETVSSSADEPNKRSKSNTRRRSLKSKFKGAAKSGNDVSNTSTVSSSTSCSTSTKNSTTSTSASSVTKNSKLQEGRNKNKVGSSTTVISAKSHLKKNLAKKRLDALKKKLNSDQKKIEPEVSAKVAQKLASKNCSSQLNKDLENILNNVKQPTNSKDLLPNIYKNCGARFKALKARIASKFSLQNAETTNDNKQPNKIVTKIPKLPKISKKLQKINNEISAANTGGGVEKAQVSEGHPVLNDAQDSFYEEMEWEPIEQEKLVFEIQEVRMHLSSDQGSVQQQKFSNYAISGLELPQTSKNSDKQIVYIVVDTNVFLSNLKTVTELLNDCPEKMNGSYSPVLVVPWTVLQELDYIKDNKWKTKSTQLQTSAKIAVDFLFQHFSSKHPRLKGQTASDALSNRTKFETVSPDDEILQNCLQIQESGCAVILLSNDKNLCNKAMVHDIPTYRSHEPISKMLSPKKKFKPEPAKAIPELSRFLENDNELISSKELELSDELFGEAKAIIKHFLSVIVSKEMKKLFGESWEKHVIVQPPWSVMDVLKCTKKHWIAAISDIFIKEAEPAIATLSKMFENGSKYGQSLKFVREVLEVCFDLVQMVNSNEYQQLSEETYSSIKELICTCQAKLKEFHEEKNQLLNVQENNNLNEEQRANNAFQYFEQIWTLTNNFCGLAADLAGIPHTMVYKTLDPTPSAERLIQVQPTLVSSLNQLINALREVLSVDEHLTTSHPALHALYYILINYFPNSGESDDHTSIDLLDLLCCINVKKDSLRTGLTQLQELSYQFCRIADFRSTSVRHN